MRDLRAEANRSAITAVTESEPVLTGIKSAKLAMGLPDNVVLTSGPALPFSLYSGGQRAGIVGGALYEKLASDEESAIAALERGDILVKGCQEYGCVGSLAGVTTASMPVVVVVDEASGNEAFCSMYEGDSADRLNYGSYTEATRENLDYLRFHTAPALNALIEAQSEPLKLKTLMARALTMGDELHSRNAAATLLFLRQLLTGSKHAAQDHLKAVLAGLSDDYFFLRLSMAASKVMASAMRNIEASSLVTTMAFSCTEFGIQVAGTGDTWFTGPLPTFEDFRLSPQFTEVDIEFMGGESTITEVVGLGGMAQAAGLPLHRSSGQSVSRMITRTTEMYEITMTESPDFLIPVLDYRGAPLGLDIEKIHDTGITPVLDIGIAGKTKMQIGGGVARAPLEPFSCAWKHMNE